VRTKKSSLAARLLLALAWGALITTSIAPPRIRGWSASAETTKVPKLRTIQGEVCSKDGRPIQGAVVYLQDSKSLAVKSYLSDDDGKFHFRHLSMNLDYDLWAELNGKRSKTKNISQFNDKPNLSYKLKLPMTK
jgi:hypothetical protein